jgi:hypothetical protein
VVWACTENGRKNNSQRNLETRLRGRPRNRWQNEVREDGRIVGGEGWQEKVYTVQESNGRTCCERQGIFAFCTFQWNEWMVLYPRRLAS